MGRAQNKQTAGALGRRSGLGERGEDPFAALMGEHRGAGRTPLFSALAAVAERELERLRAQVQAMDWDETLALLSDHAGQLGHSAHAGALTRELSASLAQETLWRWETRAQLQVENDPGSPLSFDTSADAVCAALHLPELTPEERETVRRLALRWIDEEVHTRLAAGAPGQQLRYSDQARALADDCYRRALAVPTSDRLCPAPGRTLARMLGDEQVAVLLDALGVPGTNPRHAFDRACQQVLPAAWTELLQSALDGCATAGLPEFRTDPNTGARTRTGDYTPAHVRDMTPALRRHAQSALANYL